MKSAGMLGIPRDQVVIVNDRELQDGNIKWESYIVSKYINYSIIRFNATHLITFDEYGVSKHINHISTYLGARFSVAEGTQGRVKLYSLVTQSLIVKYAGLFAMFDLLDLFELLRGSPSVPHSPDVLRIISTPKQAKIARLAMEQHVSQLVWFRRLYIIFSSYMYINVLRENKMI